MSQDDVFGRKRLTVLNRAAPSAPTQYVLDEPGLLPEPLDADTDSKVLPGIQGHVIEALRKVHDPEIPLNIYDLGLVYRVQVHPDRRVEIDMTLTSPGCPVAGVLVRQVHDAVRKISGVASVRTELVWDPPWTRDRMSEAAQFALGLI
jgi:FeS assembly SUF system protein